MYVKMRTRYAGNAGTCSPGGIIQVDDAEGKTLCEKGFAEECDAKGNAKAKRSKPKTESAAKRTSTKAE